MTTTITAGATTITPTQVLGYEANGESRNLVSYPLNGGVNVTLRADLPRSGTLSMYFALKAMAWEAYTAHGIAQTFVLADTPLTDINMTYVRSGARTITFDTDTESWLVKVGYQEVTA